MNFRIPTIAASLFILGGLAQPLYAQQLALAANKSTISADPSSSSGSISGMIKDASNGQPIEFATIAIHKSNDAQLITGGIADANGNFRIDKIPVGVYRVEINFIGYKKFTKDSILISNKNKEVALGTISLKSSAKNLNEVEVSAEKNMVENGIDKKVYNVGKDISSTGGSASQVLQNVPSVTVDQDGTVNLRGSSNVRVLIDGKPSNITGSSRQAILEQIPASAIESIEVITNPSAKYDAEGMSGIINIVLKKEAKQGINGIVSANVGTGDKYTGSLSLNIGKQNVNYNLGYDVRSYNMTGYSKLNRRNATSLYKQDQESFSKDRSHTIRAGADYTINDKNSLSLSGITVVGQSKQDSHYDEYIQDNGEVTKSLNDRNTFSLNKDFMLDLSGNYKKTFAKKGQQLTADVNFNQNSGPVSTNIYNQQLVPTSFYSDRLSIYDEKQNNVTLQSDYAQPLSEKWGKLETGVKANFRTIDADQYYDSLNSSNNIRVKDLSSSNHFIYNEQVNAAYANYSNTIGKWGIQAGLRAENTNTKSELVNTNQHFDKSYTNLFPSVFISRELANNNKLQLSYSMRINRPNIYMLNPFTDYSDPKNVRTGNPDLSPEMVRSFELNHVKYIQNWKFIQNLSISSSLYYRHADNIFRRIFNVKPDNTSTLNFINVSVADFYGGEIIVSGQITSFWRLMANVNHFESVQAGYNSMPATNFNMTFGRFSSNFTVFKLFDLQVSANYRSAFNVINGRIGEMWFADIGLRKEVLNKKGTITLRYSDIFDTRKFTVLNAGGDFTSNSEFKNESRMVFLGFSYRINNFKPKQQNKMGNDGGSMDLGGY